jgi:hypothetical protein
MQEMDRRRVAIAFGMLEDTDTDVLAARIDAERERRAELTATGEWRDAEVPVAEEPWLFPGEDGVPPTEGAVQRRVARRPRRGRVEEDDPLPQPAAPRRPVVEGQAAQDRRRGPRRLGHDRGLVRPRRPEADGPLRHPVRAGKEAAPEPARPALIRRPRKPGPGALIRAVGPTLAGSAPRRGPNWVAPPSEHRLRVCPEPLPSVVTGPSPVGARHGPPLRLPSDTGLRGGQRR